MGCDIHGFVEIESKGNSCEFDSLFQPDSLPRYSFLFGALAGVRDNVQPLFKPRGIPDELGIVGFNEFYLPVIEHCEALEYGQAGTRFVLKWDVGGREILSKPSRRWALHDVGYVIDERAEVPSWLWLSELKSAIAHAGIDLEVLQPEYRWLIASMESAEQLFERQTRFVFYFDSV